MKKKKGGFTLLEVLIAMCLTLIIMDVIYGVFFAGNRVFSEADVKTTLQMEGQDIEEKITNRALQATSLKNVKSSGVIKENFSESDFTNVSEFTINLCDYDKVSDSTSVEECTFELDNGKLIMNDSNINDRVLANNVQNFRIKNNGDKGIGVNVILSKKSRNGMIDYPVTFDITFRNADITT